MFDFMGGDIQLACGAPGFAPAFRRLKAFDGKKLTLFLFPSHPSCLISQGLD